jgi:hypothetical protein
MKYTLLSSKSRTVVVALALALGLLAFVSGTQAAFVYQSPGEFLTSGDFNGDGIADVLVLDRLTGNVRIGYGSANGVLTNWSNPLVSGVENPTGCAVGRFQQIGYDTLAVTAPGFNRVNLVDLSNPASAGTPVVVTPPGIGPHTLVAMANPAGAGVAPSFNSILSASSFNTPNAELLDLLSLSSGVATPVGEYPESAPFNQGNALQLAPLPGTLAVGIVSAITNIAVKFQVPNTTNLGVTNFVVTNTALDIWEFTNAPRVMLSLTNLAPGTAYTFGLFNGDTLPHFIFYVPGQSNVTIQPLTSISGGFAFGASANVPFAEAVQGVYFISFVTNGITNGSAIVQFGDGIEALSLSGGSVVITPEYGAGTIASGNVFTGVVPLVNGQLALLDAQAGAASSAHAQVVRFNGASFTNLSSGNMPSASTNTSRANVWLFQFEPFVTSNPVFISSLNDPDWSDTVVSLSGSISVNTEHYAGTSSGLTNPVAKPLGSAPSEAAYALLNQYTNVISIFSYGAPRPPDAVVVNISPPPGPYTGPISIAFQTFNPLDHVYYSHGAPDAWHQFSAPSFSLTNDATIQYYGSNSSSSARSRLQFATYSLGNNGQSPPNLNLSNLTSSTNPPVTPPVTNFVQLSPGGTVFYGRSSPTNPYTIWAINLDGSDDAFVTTGARPRVSRDGHYLAFLRGGTPLVTQGNIWVRDLLTGQESMLYANTNFTIGYDWDRSDTNLIFDWSCGIWHMSPGNPLPFPLPLVTDCYDDAPAVDPVTGRLAFHNLNPNPSIAGIYVTSASLTTKLKLSVSVPGASWPEWSPDGQRLAFADNVVSEAFTADGGTNLYVVNSDGTGLSQITLFTNGIDGFPHGALWSPVTNALIGAGTIFGTNGLWIIPLAPDDSQCDCPAILLPTTPGDPIDFAGSIIVAPVPSSATPVMVSVQVSASAVVISWNTNLTDFTLQSTANINTPAAWQPVNGPYTLNGSNFEYSEPINGQQPAKFFRLQLTNTNSP